MWKKERYHNDEEYRLRMIKNIRKYQKTRKGKISMKKAYEKRRKNGRYKLWFKKNPFYRSDYEKDRRWEARKNNLCLICFKRKVINGLTYCRRCKRMKLKYIEKQKFIKETIERHKKYNLYSKKYQKKIAERNWKIKETIMRKIYEKEKNKC